MAFWDVSGANPPAQIPNHDDFVPCSDGMKCGCPDAIIGRDAEENQLLNPILLEDPVQIRLFSAVILESRVTIVLRVRSFSHDGFKQLLIEQDLCSGSILNTMGRPEDPVPPRSFITSKAFFPGCRVKKEM